MTKTQRYALGAAAVVGAAVMAWRYRTWAMAHPGSGFMDWLGGMPRVFGAPPTVRATTAPPGAFGGFMPGITDSGALASGDALGVSLMKNAAGNTTANYGSGITIANKATVDARVA